MALPVRSVWGQSCSLISGLLAVLALLSGACQTAQSASTFERSEGCDAATQKAALQAINGVYFGVNLNWDEETAASYAQRLGVKPAVYVAFARFPFDGAAAQHIDEIVEQVRIESGMLMLTIEPTGGLSEVTEHTATQLGDKLASYNAQGVAVFLRFAHEMNGSWYPWSQRPIDFIRAFREIARVVHERAPLTLMVWAPNYGGGYPFMGGKFVATPGSDAFALLNTNGDGIMSMLDDPYLPYYPGDVAVDWVGMSMYHWGSAYPWGDNELPEPGKFVAQLKGNYSGANGDERALPDFYGVFSEQHGKPLAVTETSAFFTPMVGGEDEASIKRLWWRQVLSQDVRSSFPELKMINWFEWRKYETEVGREVDWRVTEPRLVDEFRRVLPAFLSFADETPICQ